MSSDGPSYLGTYCHNETKVDSLRRAIPAEGRLRSVAAALKAVGHPARVAILHLLASEDGCVCDIAHTLEIPVSTTSQHLRKLRDAGIVSSRQDGKWVIYSLVDGPLAHAVTGSAADRRKTEDAA